MTPTEYLFYGIVLVITFLIVIFYYYNRKRKDQVEAPKYRMLEDEEDDKL